MEKVKEDLGTMTSGVRDAVTTGDLEVENAALRKALQINSAILQKLACRIGDEEFGGRWLIRKRSGDVLANCTIAEALDLADKALEQ